MAYTLQFRLQKLFTISPRTALFYLCYEKKEKTKNKKKKYLSPTGFEPACKTLRNGLHISASNHYTMLDIILVDAIIIFNF